MATYYMKKLTGDIVIFTDDLSSQCSKTITLGNSATGVIKFTKNTAASCTVTLKAGQGQVVDVIDTV